MSWQTIGLCFLIMQLVGSVQVLVMGCKIAARRKREEGKA